MPSDRPQLTAAQKTMVHQALLRRCLIQVQEVRRGHTGTGVVLIVDCADPDFRSLAQILDLEIPAGAFAAEVYMLAVGLVPLEVCRKAFPSSLFPKAAQSLERETAALVGYRVLVMAERGVTSWQVVVDSDGQPIASQF